MTRPRSKPEPAEGDASTSLNPPQRTLQTNFLINAAGALVPIGISLVTVPIYIRHIGPARYGVLSIVWVLLGYFGFLDLGLSRAAANALARLRGASQQARARLLVTTITLNVLLGLLGSLVLALAGRFLLQHVLSIPAELKPEIAGAFPWIVGLFPLALVSGVAVGSLEAREEFLRVNVVVGVGSSLGQIVPALLAVWLRPSLDLVIPAAAVIRGLTVLALLASMLRLEGPLRPRDFDPAQVSHLLRYGGWVSLSGVIGPILTSVDQVIIGTLLGVAMVAYYAVPMNLTTRSQILVAALARTLFPRMSSSTSDAASALGVRASLAAGFGYALVCAPALVAAPVLLRFWVGAEFAEQATPVFRILLLGAWINGLAFVPYQLLQAQGRPDIVGKFHALELAPFLALVSILTYRYGLVGAATAWAVRSSVDAALLFRVAKFRRAELVPLVAPMGLMLLAAVFSVWCSGDQRWIAAGTLAVAAAMTAAALVFVAEFRRIARTCLSRAGLLRSARLEFGSADR